MGSLSLEASTPLVVKVRLPRDVQTFSDLAQVTNALRYLDNLQVESLLGPEQQLRFRRRGKAKVLHFSSSSPPDFTVLADPQWLTLLITVLIGYHRIGPNLHQITDDLGGTLNRVRGLTREKRLELEAGVRFLLDELLRRGEEGALWTARAFARRRRALIPGEGWPDGFEIDVIDVDDWEHGEGRDFR